MFTPTLKGYPKIVNAHGELNVTWENLRNGYKKAKLFRLMEFEALGDMKFAKEQKYNKLDNAEVSQATFVESYNMGSDDVECPIAVDENNYNKHKLSHLGGHYVIMVVPYKILTTRTTPVPPTAGITIKCQVGTGHTKGISIPEAGTCVIKGNIPFIVPYVRYTAVVEFYVETHGTSASASKGTHGKDMVHYGFKIVQVVRCEVNPKETMRVLDLDNILRDESVKMSHLFDSFLDESRDKLGQQQRFYKMGDVWSLSYLDPGGINYKTLVSKLPDSKWGHLSKRALILKVYPNLAHYILEQFTEKELSALQKKLAERAQNWFFALFPFELVKLFPLRFVKLITDNYGNCYKVSPLLLNKGGDVCCSCDSTQLELWESEQKKCYDWMLCMKDQPVNQKLLAYMTPAQDSLVLSPLKLQFIEFYNTEIVNRMLSTNSTACILSRESLSKEIHSKKYDLLFNPTSGLGLDKILNSLGHAGRLVRLDNVTFCNLRDQYIPRISSNTTADIEALSRRLFLECVPNNCYTLVEMWTISQKIISRLFDLRENMTQACLHTSFNHEEFHNQKTEDNCYWFHVEQSPSEENEEEEGRPLEIILTREQTDAILATTSNAVVCVIGMPGTGKTLFIEALCRLYNQYHYEEDNGEGAKLIIRVAVVTHGGCMANELKKRGIPGAQNIHMALKKRYLPVPINKSSEKIKGEEAFETLDYSAIEVLVIDEFSNVSDELAAALYSKEVFPNLRCIVHVFDPIQNQPIGNGALSIDYMQSFPKATTSTQQQQPLNSLGVTLALKKCHRFDTEGLIGINDAIVTQNCKTPFVFDEESFIQYECHSLPPLKIIQALQKLLKSNQNVVKLRSDLIKYLPKGKYALWDVLSGSHEKVINFYTFGTQSQERASNYSQLLTLTNELCGTINTLCDFLHTLTYFEGLDNLVREEILDPESQSVKEEEEVNAKVDLLLAPPLKVSVALCRGARVLVRDFRPSQRVHIDINHNPEQIRPLFEECCRSARYLPTILLPKLSKNVTESTQAEISKSQYKEIIGAIEDVFADYDFLRQMYSELQVIADQYMNIFSSPLFNGTTFTFLGVVDLKIHKVTANDIISLLKEEEAILVSEVTVMFAENKGKGSKARKEEIFREGKDIHKQIYSPQNIYQKLLDLESNRWRLPKFSSVPASIYKALYPHLQRDGNTAQYPLTGDMGSAVFPHLPLASSSDPKTSVPVKEMYGSDNQHNADTFLRFILGSDNMIYVIDQQINKVELLQSGWTITVDFSQGKEYENVALVLPKMSAEPVPRSMVDTTFAKFERSHIHVSISRAKKKFILFGDIEAMQEIASRNGDRLSSRFTLLGPLLKYLGYSLLLENYIRDKK